jgi:hypothetical protein
MSMEGTAYDTGKTKRQSAMHILTYGAIGVAFVFLAYLPNLVLRQAGEARRETKSPSGNSSPLGAVVQTSDGGAAEAAGIDSLLQAARSEELSAAQWDPFAEPDQRLADEPPDWKRLHSYAVVLEFSPSGAEVLGKQPLVLEGESLYERALQGFELRAAAKANCALYVQVGAVLDLAKFLRHQGPQALVKEYLQSRLDYPKSSDFQIRQDVAADGSRCLVYDYAGGLALSGSHRYRLLLREGRQPTEQQSTQFLEQCALNIAIRAMKQQVEASASLDSPAFTGFLQDPSERTLAALLREQGRAYIEIPDYDPFSYTLRVTQLKLPGISLRGLSPARRVRGDS